MTQHLLLVSVSVCRRLNASVKITSSVVLQVKLG